MKKDLHHAVGNSASVMVCCLERLKEIIIQAAFSLRAYAIPVLENLSIRGIFVPKMLRLKELILELCGISTKELMFLSCI